jgi:sterol desaturase/sphingolipid hydroxylase (fatty acid hydroxylase superfamily)
MMEAVLIPIVAILSTIALPIVTALVLILKKLNADHNERMALINQGIIPPNEPKKKTNPNRMVSLRNGIILAALGIGIIVGFLCSQYLVIGEENKFWIMSASIVFFLGVGYLVYFLATRNMPRESQIEQPCE